MKFESNARWNEPKENGTIFKLKDNELRISIHRLMGVEDTWFLSCYALGMSQRDLHTNDFNKAVEKAKILINQEIDELLGQYVKLACDDTIEIV